MDASRMIGVGVTVPQVAVRRAEEVSAADDAAVSYTPALKFNDARNSQYTSLLV